MSIATGILAAALLGAAGDAESAAGAVPITYHVRFIDTADPRWREAVAPTLTLVAQQGGATVWSADAATYRKLVDAVAASPRSNLVQAPTLHAAPGAEVRVAHESKVRFIVGVDRLVQGTLNGPKRVAFKPHVGTVPDGVRLTARGREIDQGVLARLTVEGSKVQAMESVLAFAGGPDEPRATVQVPVVSGGKVEGEWLIPTDGYLVVNLGAYRAETKTGRKVEPVTRERLVVISAEPAATEADGSIARAAYIPPQDPPAEPADQPPAEPADQPPAEPNARMPELPSRSLPEARDEEGKLIPLPPLPADPEEITPADPSAEPAPSPQARHIDPQAAAEAPDDSEGHGDSSLADAPAPRPLRIAPKVQVSVRIRATRGPAPTRPRPDADAPGVRALALDDAIRMALENSAAVHVVWASDEDGEEITVAPRDDDPCPYGFRSGLQALVRSVEQTYWSLAEQQVRLWSRETAVELGEMIHEREVAKLKDGRGSLPDVAEADEQLERFRLERVTAAADVSRTERQLRDLLGLPARDDRRIIPITSPEMTPFDQDWNTCLAAMEANQPDLQAQRERLGVAAIGVAAAGSPFLAEIVQVAFPTVGSAACDTEPSRDRLDRERESLKQVKHLTTHSLARFFLEADANYKQFKTAGRLRDAALARLEAQKSSYNEGDITINRYLDAVNRWAAAVAAEARFRSMYQVSLAALEEAKGTLLDREHIAVVEPSRRADPIAGRAKDPEVVTASARPEGGCADESGCEVDAHRLAAGLGLGGAAHRLGHSIGIRVVSADELNPDASGRVALPIEPGLVVRSVEYVAGPTPRLNVVGSPKDDPTQTHVYNIDLAPKAQPDCDPKLEPASADEPCCDQEAAAPECDSDADQAATAPPTPIHIPVGYFTLQITPKTPQSPGRLAFYAPFGLGAW